MAPPGNTVEMQEAEQQPFLPKMTVEKEAPKDKGLLVYWIVLLNGLGVLMPWNMFITIAPQYYVDYWFTEVTGPNKTVTSYGKAYMNAQSVASQFPNLLINIINIVLVIGGPLMFRIAGPLVVNCINIAIVLAFIVFVDPSTDAMGWYFWVTMAIIVVMNFANGLYQNSMFGLAADFPAKYSNALVLGSNVCGTFTTVVSIICNLALPDNTKTVALIYFAIALVTLGLCGVSLWLLTQQKFYNYYKNKGEELRAASTDEKPSFSQTMAGITACAKQAWIQFFNIFFVFFVTLSVFPSVMASTPLYRSTPDEHWYSVWPENIYTSITTFLNFNVFATVGSFLADYKQIVGPKYLWVPVVARAVFIPFFMFCNYLPDDRNFVVLFKNEWIFFCGGIVMAISSGYFSSLGMMYAPRVVDPSLAKTAGMTAALCLVFGIFAGCAFTYIITLITTGSFT